MLGAVRGFCPQSSKHLSKQRAFHQAAPQNFQGPSPMALDKEKLSTFSMSGVVFKELTICEIDVTWVCPLNQLSR